MKRKLIWVSMGLILSVAGYYLHEVLNARRSTGEIIRAAKSRISHPISRSDLSEEQLRELLAVQDPNFFSHAGTDFSGGRITTITQSLVKLLYFSQFKPGLAKVKQSLIARCALDPLVSKDEQLDLFLNLSYFGQFKGQDVRGFDSAAKVYFGKALQDLKQEEYLQILAMLFGPLIYNVKTNPEKNAEQVALLQKTLRNKN